MSYSAPTTIVYVYDVNTLSYIVMTQPTVSTDTLNVTLPATAATAARQDTGNASLASIAAEDFATQETLAALNAKVTAVNTGAVVVTSAPTTAVTGAFWQTTQPISAASLPLPTSAATETTLAAIKTQTDKLAFTGSLLQTTASIISGGDGAILDGVNPLVKATVTASNAVKVDGSAVTQPVSAASLPLPTNAAAETGGNLATIAAKDFATQTTLAALNAKVTAVNTGAVVVTTMPTTTVTATDLDIRNLAKASDEVYSVVRTDAGVAYDARDRNWTITETVPVTQGALSTLEDDRVELAASGLAQQLPTVTAKSVELVADSSNVGVLVVGSVNVVADRRNRRGIPLWPGDSVKLSVSNLNLLYVNGTVRKDAVSYTVLA